jgi:multidrug efflux system membrane fusion protein
VTVARAYQSDVSIEVRVPATVTPFVTVSVKSEVSGVLRRTLVHEGATVRVGDALFEIEPAPFEAALRQAKAQLERDTAQKRQAEATLERDIAAAQNADTQADRYDHLASDGVISKEQQEQVRTAARVADRSIAVDRAALDVATGAARIDQAAVERAQVDLDHCTIRSPLAGVTGYLAVQQGNFVRTDADTPLITINEVTPVFVSFGVPDRYLQQVRRGVRNSPLPLSVFSPGSTQPVAQGFVREVNNSVDISAGAIHLRAELTNQDHRLWPGQFVDAVLTLSTDRNVIVVPKAAVEMGEHGSYVFTVRRDSTVDQRPVRIGAATEDKVEILEGIGPGEEVVTDGQLRLRPGAKVSLSPIRQPVRGWRLNPSAVFIRRPVASILLALALVVFGLLSYRALPVSDLPSIEFPTITVSASLPGASPEMMAASIATPLERQLSSISGIDSMHSTSIQGSTSITVQFALDRNIDGAGQDVQAAISQAGPELPPNMPSPPAYRKSNAASFPILFLSVRSDSLPMHLVNYYAETVIAPRLSTVSGVAQVLLSARKSTQSGCALIRSL